MVTEAESTEMTDEVWAVLTEQHADLKARIAAAKEVEHATGEYQLDRTASPGGADRGLGRAAARCSGRSCSSVPEDFTVHPKLVKQLEQRREALAGDEPAIVWAHAESLAFASLLTEGIPIRLTGQDAERGTFSQRHLVLHDPKTGREHCAVQHLPGRAGADGAPQLARCRRWPASGFEYGYSQEGPETLVLWEAQFGDFVNGAQVIIDQFIISGHGQVGPDLAPDAAAAARLRGLRPRALQRPARALPAARRRGQHPGGQPHHPGAVLPPAAPPGADRQAAPARGDDAQEPAPPAAGRRAGSASSPRAASSRCWPSPASTRRRSSG